MSQSSLPSFRNPPVVEVVCGIAFRPLEDFKVPRFGELWAEFKNEYPGCDDKPPLGEVIEDYGPAVNPRIRISVSPPVVPRVWFVSNDETRLIQVQRDRFLHNWRKIQTQDEYPRYPGVMSEFKANLDRFDAFLSSRSLGILEPTQCELTYVNLIPKGDGWESLDQIGGLLPDFSWRSVSERFLPEPEQNQWNTTFLLPAQSGRLRVAIQKVIRVIDKREAIRLELTVRGMPSEATRDAMYSWFDTAREWIVRGFADITSEEVQNRCWERIS